MSVRTMQLIAQGGALLGCIAGTVYGILKVWVEKKPMYMKIVVMAVGCAMLSRFFNVACILNEGELREGFNVGDLGCIGMFLGCLSANFGQFDGIVDDKSAQFKKYRRLPALGLLLPIAAVFIIGASSLSPSRKIIDLVSLLLMGMALYYHTKHLIFPDVDLGLAKSIRGYNLFAIVYAVLALTEMIAAAYNAYILSMICALLMGVVITLLIVSLKRGVDNWIK